MIFAATTRFLPPTSGNGCSPRQVLWARHPSCFRYQQVSHRTACCLLQVRLVVASLRDSNRTEGSQRSAATALPQRLCGFAPLNHSHPTTVLNHSNSICVQRSHRNPPVTG